MLALALLFRLVKELVERNVLDVADRAIVHAMWALPIWPMLAKQFLGHFLALLLVNRLRAIEALSLWSMHAFLLVRLMALQLLFLLVILHAVQTFRLHAVLAELR